MDQKAADELVGIERHKLVASVELGPVILAFEGHLLAVEGDEPAVGDRDPVGVAGQISEDSVGSAEGSLGIDHPFDLRLLSWVRFLALNLKTGRSSPATLPTLLSLQVTARAVWSCAQHVR
jgi:hypothetical protein